MSAAPLTLINACIEGDATSVRILDGRIASTGELPQTADRVIDLQGDRLLPGLINAHDHLQLNGLPATHAAQSYQHVREWIRDINARRVVDTEFEAAIAVARDARLLQGGLKNLLSGVTTVAHHDPFYASLANPEFPVSVIRHYGWSHSLDIDGEAAISTAYARTPPAWPWIVHAAEGVDDSAVQEFERLEALGCIAPNTLLVHGVALRSAQRARLARVGAGLIWCPTSNLRLFGATAGVEDLIGAGQVALGSDSRLSGSRDLLQELQVAGAHLNCDEKTLIRLVTHDAARMLRLADRGTLACGRRADLLVLPASAHLRAADRAQVRLVLLEGEFRYGDRRYAQQLAAPGTAQPIEVDGVPKMLAANIATALHLTRLREPGVQIFKRQ